MVDVAGIEHVCIGTDTKLTPAYKSPGDFGPKPGTSPQQSSNPGNHKDSNDKNDPGGDNNRNRFGNGTNQTWPDQKTGFYFTVVDALLKTGFTEKEIGKIGGANFCRVFDAATAGHQ